MFHRKFPATALAHRSFIYFYPHACFPCINPHPPPAYALDIAIADGPITIEPGTNSGLKVIEENGQTYDNVDKILLGGTYSGLIDDGKSFVTVQGGAIADITLSNATIEMINQSGSGKYNLCAFEIKGNSTVSLTLSGTNVLTSTGFRAGLEVSGDNKLTITGTTTNDTLTATGGYFGAGIGGSSLVSLNAYDGGTVSISGGTVTAKGYGGAAGIGGGIGGGKGCELTINGGIVIATGDADGAGIGGGLGADGGNGGSGGTVSIIGGTITATGGPSGTGIGGGRGGGGNGGIGGGGGTVNISGGTVTVSGKHIDIGGGSGGSNSAGATIVITGGSVHPLNGAGKVAGQPKNGTTLSSVNVYLNTLTVSGDQLITHKNVSSCKIDNVSNAYGVTNVFTDDEGKLYFWLPAKTDGSVDVTIESTRYWEDFDRDDENKTAAMLLPYESLIRFDLSSLWLSANQTLRFNVSDDVDLLIKAFPKGTTLSADNLPPNLSLSPDGKLTGTLGAVDVGEWDVVITAKNSSYSTEAETKFKIIVSELTAPATFTGSHSSCATGAAGGLAIAGAAGAVLARRKRRGTRRA